MAGAPGTDPSPNQSSGANGSDIFNPQAGYLNSEARRTLASPTYITTGGPASIQVPRDTVLKKMYLKLSMSFSVTYASGSPVTSEQGFFDRICSYIEFNINGNRLIKGVRPHLVRLHNIIANGEVMRRAYSTAAAAATSTRGLREWFAGTVAYPATTQFFQVAEGIELNFENPWGYGGSRSMTELDIRDVASADLRFVFQNLTNLQRDGVGATVTYGSAIVTINPQIVENRARPRPTPGQVLFDYVEAYATKTYTGQARQQQFDLQTGNYLMGIGIYVNNGDTNQSPAENLLTNLNLQINGATSLIGPVSHQDLQDQNQSRYGCNDYFGLADYNATIASTAGAHPLQGFAFMNLIRNGDWNTALNTSRQAGTDSVKLLLDTPASSGTDAATYTNPLQVVAHTHEIRPYVYTR